jgi:hypothetical protein
MLSWFLVFATIAMSQADEGNISGEIDGWLLFARTSGAEGFVSDSFFPSQDQGSDPHRTAVTSTNAPSAPVGLDYAGVQQISTMSLSQQAVHNIRVGRDVVSNDDDSVKVASDVSETLTGLASRSAGLEERLGALANSGFANTVFPQSDVYVNSQTIINPVSAVTVSNRNAGVGAFTDKTIINFASNFRKIDPKPLPTLLRNSKKINPEPLRIILQTFKLSTK